MVYQAAWLQSDRPGRLHGVSHGQGRSPPSTRCKAADLGIQILGGMGYSAETDMQRYWRDARLFRIGPVTNEMARNSIAESLGLPRSF